MPAKMVKFLKIWYQKRQLDSGGGSDIARVSLPDKIKKMEAVSECFTKKN